MERKILFVEDNQYVLDRWQSSMKRHMKGYDFNFITAASILEAQVQFKNNAGIDLIVVCACVPGIDLNTLPLIEEFKKTFKGHLIAVSNNPEYRQKMRKAGCDDACEMSGVFRAVKESINSRSTLKSNETPRAYA